MPTRAELTSRKALRSYGVVLLIVVLLTFTLGFGKTDVNDVVLQLDGFSKAIQSLGFIGYLTLAALVSLTSFPPLIGLNFAVFLCGYVFGFPYGFIPAYLGALGGAVGCFSIARQLLSKYRSRILERFSFSDALEQAIERGGMEIILLIRLAPYPHNVINTLFGITSMSLRQHVIASSLAFWKLVYPVYIGSALQTFVHGTTVIPAPTFVLTVGLVTTTVVFIYINIAAMNGITTAEATFQPASPPTKTEPPPMEQSPPQAAAYPESRTIQRSPSEARPLTEFVAIELNPPQPIPYPAPLSIQESPSETRPLRDFITIPQSSLQPVSHTEFVEITQQNSLQRDVPASSPSDSAATLPVRPMKAAGRSIGKRNLSI
ncbi:hypothetical protein SeMB42_g06413 [Synchytrium endobioticum]|nr:hypothetical protein SeMB42_g06413 [Synchytrium endobioticum]